jgi:carboxypeptidase Q
MKNISGKPVLIFGRWKIINSPYFRFHHSGGDSMLVEDTKNLDKCAALWAAAAYIIADLDMDIPRNFD